MVIPLFCGVNKAKTASLNYLFAYSYCFVIGLICLTIFWNTGQAQVAERKYTVAEFLEMEEKSETRHEFYDGEIFAMADKTMNQRTHN